MKTEDVVITQDAIEHLSLEGEGGTQCRVRGKVNKAGLICTPSSVLRTSSPSRGKWTAGFTLIELLVVVLIIGILAAVAVPQYQKAIWKSRLAQWDVMVGAGRKAIEAYLLENGWPDTTVYLTGKDRVGTVEMPGNCDISNSYCWTSAGGVEVSCSASLCNIRIRSDYNADGTKGNKALGDEPARVTYNRLKAGDSCFGRATGKAGCQWVSTHPDIPAYSDVITDCKNVYGVTLPNPECTN